MKVLVTGAAHPLAQALMASLEESYVFRLLDGSSERTGAESIPGSLLDPETAKAAVAGMDAIVHCLPLVMLEAASKGLSDFEVLDQATRGTYQLLTAAGEAGVQRCLFISSFVLFEGCPPGAYLSEAWMPRPEAKAGSLALYLAELTAREFGRTRQMAVLCLRVAPLACEEEMQGKALDPRWLDVRDAVFACRKALEIPLEQPRWWVYHIASDFPDTPYAIDRARRPPLSYTPQYRFGIKLEQGG